MGVFDRKCYGVWNNSSVLEEMVEDGICLGYDEELIGTICSKEK